MKHLSIFLLALLSLNAIAQDRSLSTAEVELQRLRQDPGLKHGEVGFVAVNLDNGGIIAEFNSYRAMIPASIQKLLTTSNAFSTLGNDYRFKTRIAYTGEIIEGILHGDIVIYGGGDPTFNSKYFPNQNHDQAIKEAATKAGIKSITGKLVFDLSIYTEHTTPSGWVWEDMGNYFGATPTAFMWADNTINLDLRSGQAGTDVMLADSWPSDSPYTLDVDIKASTENKDNAWFYSAPKGNTIYGKGSIPAHKDRFTVKISDPDPVQSYAKHLEKLLGLKNIAIQRNYAHIEYASAKTLIDLSSPSLKEIINVTNKQSINLYAEALNLISDTAQELKSVEGGIQSLEAFLTKNKIRHQGNRFLDGSGVSPMNRMTPQVMIDLLSVMYRSPLKEDFQSTLAVGGQSGTFKYYFKSGIAAGNIMGKSGTMNGVRNYAGYVKNKYGETIAFCLMMNDYDEDRKSEIMKKVETLMEAVIEH
ncbi:D-alanyl-D-alanine carboxypeptidase/D-alanyl-D-alanine-endopeptidase [Salibacteraceae bacterium]|jgi:D-alanyl-D-alanine carboxypeptidase/D-alanyl-D-alanine-endopeptidase (penicillin-binding protein 4)|nr:D-alanyl-D-alanine carboxypeptidase/D-alanyl-D-alanine-endopeptidase [Salibacteraceae bacterium]MDB9709620.1 D-alanyl-D-alanine carboxypeptidase/D-alanyl-D-alanine-endopeptidase [Salibacteraceae bacterium]